MIDEDLLEALRDALVRRLRGSSDDGEVRHALRVISHIAKARAMRAEQIVIALKRVWESLPDVRDAGTARERARLLDRLVTLCIEEYYRDAE